MERGLESDELFEMWQIITLFKNEYLDWEGRMLYEVMNSGPMSIYEIYMIEVERFECCDDCYRLLRYT
jgi:hypothetical protein